MLMPLRAVTSRWRRGKRCKTRSTKPLSANLNITTTRRGALRRRVPPARGEPAGGAVFRWCAARAQPNRDPVHSSSHLCPEKRDERRRRLEGSGRTSLRPVKGAGGICARVPFAFHPGCPDRLVHTTLDRSGCPVSFCSSSSSRLHPRRKTCFCFSVRSLPSLSPSSVDPRGPRDRTRGSRAVGHCAKIRRKSSSSRARRERDTTFSRCLSAARWYRLNL